MGTNPLRERLIEYRDERGRLLKTIGMLTPPNAKYAKDYFRHIGLSGPQNNPQEVEEDDSYTLMGELLDEVQSAASGGYLTGLTEGEKYELQEMVEVFEALTDRFRVFAHRGGEQYRDLKRKFRDTKEVIE